MRWRILFARAEPLISPSVSRRPAAARPRSGSDALDDELALLEHPGVHRLVLVGAEEVDPGLVDATRWSRRRPGARSCTGARRAGSSSRAGSRGDRSPAAGSTCRKASFTSVPQYGFSVGGATCMICAPVTFGRGIRHVHEAEHQRISGVVDVPPSGPRRRSRPMTRMAATANSIPSRFIIFFPLGCNQNRREYSESVPIGRVAKFQVGAFKGCRRASRIHARAP